MFLLNNPDSRLVLGYNLSYRGAHNLQFSKIFGNNYSFTGIDLRFGFEAELNLDSLELQSEYIEAYLSNRKAYRCYVLADYMFAVKNLVALSVEQFNDLNPSTIDKPYYIIGYSKVSFRERSKTFKFNVSSHTQIV